MSGRGVAWRRRMILGAVAASMIAGPAALADTGPATPPGPAAPAPGHRHVPKVSGDVLVQYGSTAADAQTLVDSVLPPGQARKLYDQLPLVAAKLSAKDVQRLVAAGATVTSDEPVAFASTTTATSCPSFSTTSTPTGYFPQDSGADRLAAAGDTGQGQTVAVIDTGIDASLPDFGNRVIGGVDLTGAPNPSPFTDEYGHGTFVAGLIAGNGASSGGRYVGEAPGADLVSIKVAGADGSTNLSKVLAGINWAIRNRETYHITVLNLSLGAIPSGPTVTEPLDQAVEAAWRAGITVVTAAGNSGPAAGTITSPGDDPLVITAGAYADNNSPDPSSWYGCPFSSEGPTAFDAWVKPDLVAPGRSVVSLLDPGSTIAKANPGAVVGTGNFVGSGTSFSTAITAGAAALVLADHPGISPDEVKGRLLANAIPDDTGNPAAEGHGFLNAYYAATGPTVTLNQWPAVFAEYANLFTEPSLSSAWAAGTWNPKNWNGTAWNGSAWTGSAWTGSAWTGSAWTGSAWTGTAWNGSAWTGSAWTGSAWTGSAWTGTAWNGSAWTGSAWTGSAWTGSAWTGSAWTGSAWTGSAWTGSAWTGSAWTGSAWTGSAWTGSAWTGSAWTGSAWTGSAWTGSAWT